MYNTTSENDNSNGYSESKYAVADILSSMASGRPVSNSYTTMPAYTCGIMTGTTPTLTPTTLASIEQTFIELQSVPVSTPSQDPLTQSGFVPPIIDHISNSSQGSSYDYDDDSSSGSEWSVAPKRIRYADNSSNADSYGKAPTSRRGRRRHDLQLSPEEEGRRRVRRERNKLAAAKCRQRRVDHTNRLIDETDGLEDEKHSLETEIQTLQQQKDQLEFILQTHKPMCKVRTLLNRNENHLATKVKLEPKSPSCSGPIDCSRPTSLPLLKRDNVISMNGTGIPITTPSSGYFNFTGLDSIVDVSSGLTPITSRPSCGSQVCRNPSDGGSPTLISL